MTEANGTVTLIVGEDYLARPASVGVVLPIDDFLLVNPDTGVESNPGELWIRGSNLAKGYLDDEQATNKSWTVDGCKLLILLILIAIDFGSRVPNW